MEEDIGGACSTEEINSKVLKQMDHLGDLSLGGRILKWILKK
jgi:hypothetical protein